MPQSLWGAVRRTIPMGLIYGAGLQPLMILVNLPPGALPQADMKRAFGASSLWRMIDRPSPECINSRGGLKIRPGGLKSLRAGSWPRTLTCRKWYDPIRLEARGSAANKTDLIAV